MFYLYIFLTEDHFNGGVLFDPTVKSHGSNSVFSTECSLCFATGLIKIDEGMLEVFVIAGTAVICGHM